MALSEFVRAMSAKRRKNKKYQLKERYTPTVQLKENLKKINWKLVIQLIISFIIIMSIYQTALSFQFAPIMPIYYAILIVSILAFLWFNKGINRKPVQREQLPVEWSENEKDRFLTKQIRDKNISKKILLIIIPLLFTFAIDVIYLFYFN